MGFAAGMQAGSAMAQRGIDIYEKAKLRQDLAQVYAKPETSQGYTAQDGQRLEELANTGAYDIVPQYAPSEDPQKQGVFTGYRAVPKAGLDLQGDVPADGAYINVAPRQVQDYGGQRVAGQFDPAQLRGLQAREAARVVGASGDYRGAAALEAQASEQEYRAEDRAYQARIRPEQEKQLRLQGVLTEGQIADRQKLRDREAKVETVDTDVSGFLTKRLTGPDGEIRPPSMDDNIAALQFRATALQKAGLNKEATDSLKDYQGFAVNQITLDTKERDAQIGPAIAALADGNFGPVVAFYDRYVLDGAKVTGMTQDPKTGAITVSRTRDDGEPMADKVIKGGVNQLQAALRSFSNPSALYDFSQNEFKNNLDLKNFNLRVQTENRQAAEAKVTPLEKTVQGLKNLGIKVTPSMVESMAGLDKADSPRLKAQLSIIEKAVAEGTLKPEEGLKRVNDVFTDFQKGKQAVRDQTEIVDGIKAEFKAGKLPALIDFLKTKRGYTDAALAPLFEEAGVQMPASAAPAAAPATAPAVSPKTGLSSGRQQKYGPLTPMATIEADALAGNTNAIAYLKQLAEDAKNRDRAKTENAMQAAQGE